MTAINPNEIPLMLALGVPLALIIYAIAKDMLHCRRWKKEMLKKL